MKISTRSRYGLNAMFELAIHYGKGTMALKDIAASQSISEAYLEQLMIRLRRAKLVDSHRGVQGGYMLSAPPDKILLGDVIRVLEGSVSPVDCLDGEGCGREQCPGRLIWEKVYKSINEVIDNITLADLLEEYAQKAQLTQE